MTQTSNHLLDEFAKLMTDAAGVAQGVQREASTLMRSQAERFLADMDLVQREEFEAVKEMAAKARTENQELKTRLAELEQAIAAIAKGSGTKAPRKQAPAKPTVSKSAKTPEKADE